MYIAIKNFTFYLFFSSVQTFAPTADPPEFMKLKIHLQILDSLCTLHLYLIRLLICLLRLSSFHLLRFVQLSDAFPLGTNSGGDLNLEIFCSTIDLLCTLYVTRVNGFIHGEYLLLFPLIFRLWLIIFLYL